MLRRHAIVYFALWSVAVTQPVIDLYGRNLTVFSAAKMGALEIIVFLALLVGAVPALLICAEAVAARIGPRTQSAIHAVFLWPVLLAIALLIFRSVGIGTDAIVYPGAVVVASGLLWTYTKFPSVRTWVSWLSVVAVVSTSTFVIQAWPLLRGASPPLAEATIEETDVPVLLVVLDELPLYALLAETGNVNGERFPGFARLQSDGTWYRDAVAAANFTHIAVPAILASEVAHQTSAPVAAAYPRNLFTLLGGVTSVDAIEPVTSLCPRTVCSSASAERTGFDMGRLGSFFVDAATVYALRILPSGTRSHLPDTARGWDGFVNVAKNFVASDGELAQLEAIETGARRLTGPDAPQISVVHAMAPHSPWYLTPDRQLGAKWWNPGTNPQDHERVRYHYQTLLYQLAATDAALLDAIGHLETAGLWDESLVIVTADHGISFIPGMPARNSLLVSPQQVSDLYRVPLFVKYPGQESGRTDDCPAANIDVVPTIAEVLGVDTDWTFDGESLAGPTCPSRKSRRIFSAQNKEAEVVDGFESTMERVAFYSNFVNPSGDTSQIARVGEAAPLVGAMIDLEGLPQMPNPPLWKIDVDGVFDRAAEGEGDRSAAILIGGIWGDFPVGTEALITVNGVGAGVIGLSGKTGAFGYGVVLDHRLLQRIAAPYSLEMVLRDADGRLTRVGPPNWEA